MNFCFKLQNWHNNTITVQGLKGKSLWVISVLLHGSLSVSETAVILFVAST
uniref:Uncharacterized protein n=1 Tax=Anguilla anguilla TaxID=7936 RepID=A0A0E9UM84_ANGAN